MGELFEVMLTGYPKAKFEHIERVIHKHNRAYTHSEVHEMTLAVGKGDERVVAVYAEEHVAKNVVFELQYHGAEAHVRQPQAQEDAA